VSAEDFTAMIAAWCDRYPIVSIEDPLGEDDWEGWALCAETLCDRVQLLGDDLLVTDVDRVRRASEERVANAVIVKPNQCGTVSGAEAVIRAARAGSLATVVSARSGDTEDAWLADLAVGWGADQIKVGSTTRSERTAKWNRLLRIEAVSPSATFAGQRGLAPLRQSG
jgi:enolase